MSALNMTGQGPDWPYGKFASFGLYVRSLKDEKLLVTLYKGSLFRRKTTFLWKKTVEAVDPESEAAQTGDNVSFEFKQAIEAELVTFGACGAAIPFSDFPIYVFAGNSAILYTDESMGKFKKMKSVDDSKFYSIKDAESAEAFDLPEPDMTVYANENEFSQDAGASESSGTETSSVDGVVENTKRGLLTPLWRISAKKSSIGSVLVDEVMNLLASDTFVFAEMRDDGAGEEEPEPEDEECDPHGDPGDDGSGGGGEGEGGGEGGGGGGGGAEEGIDDPAGEEETKNPC